MYGRLVEIEGVDPSHREEILGILRERIIPGLKEFDGFAGFISLVDEEKHRARYVVLFETKEAAEEAERKFGRRFAKRPLAGMGGTVRSADLFEAAPRRGARRRTRLVVGRRCGPFGGLHLCPHRFVSAASRAI